MTMARTFTDPFTSDGTSIDGTLTPLGSSPWDGYSYQDTEGETWTLKPLTKDKDTGQSVVPAGGIIQVLLQMKTKPDNWRATLPANPNATPPHQSIALYSDTLVSTLEDIDNANYKLHVLQKQGGGGWFWLALLAVWALSKKGRR